MFDKLQFVVLVVRTDLESVIRLQVCPDCLSLWERVRERA